MSTIAFTQHLMPDGRKQTVTMTSPPEVSVTDWTDAVSKADELIAKGYTFHCEMLSDYKTISLTVVDPDDEYDFAIKVCPNGSVVPIGVVELVKDAHSRA